MAATQHWVRATGRFENNVHRKGVREPDRAAEGGRSGRRGSWCRRSLQPLMPAVRPLEPECGEGSAKIPSPRGCSPAARNRKKQEGNEQALNSPFDHVKLWRNLHPLPLKAEWDDEASAFGLMRAMSHLFMPCPKERVAIFA